MSAHESAIGATVSQSGASNPTAQLLDAAEAPVPRERAARRTMTQIHVFSALFWAAMFTMHTTQMILANGHENWPSIRWRAAMNILAFVL